MYPRVEDGWHASIGLCVSFNETQNRQRERPITVLDRIFIRSYRPITIPQSPIAGVEESEERPESVDSRYPCSRSILVGELLGKGPGRRVKVAL